MNLATTLILIIGEPDYRLFPNKKNSSARVKVLFPEYYHDEQDVEIELLLWDEQANFFVENYKMGEYLIVSGHLAFRKQWKDSYLEPIVEYVISDLSPYWIYENGESPEFLEDDGPCPIEPTFKKVKEEIEADCTVEFEFDNSGIH